LRGLGLAATLAARPWQCYLHRSAALHRFSHNVFTQRTEASGLFCAPHMTALTVLVCSCLSCCPCLGMRSLLLWLTTSPRVRRHTALWYGPCKVLQLCHLRLSAVALLWTAVSASCCTCVCGRLVAGVHSSVQNNMHVSHIPHFLAAEILSMLQQVGFSGGCLPCNWLQA
jgi:hypothetical protein